jgi:hypothetical protein
VSEKKDPIAIPEIHSPAKKELQFNCSLTIVSITRVIWPQNYSFFSSNNCSFSSIKNAVLLLSLLKNFDKKRFDVGQDGTFNSEVDNSSRLPLDQLTYQIGRHL